MLHLITGLGVGGAENQLVNLMKVWINGPIRHVVVSLTDDGPMAEPLRELGIKVVALNTKRNWTSLSAVPKFSAIVQQVRPDVIQTWMYHADLIGGLVAKLRKIPCVWNIRQANLSPEVNRRSTLATMRLCASLSPFVPHRIVTNAYLAKDVHVAAGYQAHKFVIIPNGFNTQTFEYKPQLRDIVRSQLGIQQDAFVIGHVARLDPQKDHGTLFKAIKTHLAQNASTVFLLIGSGLQADNPTVQAWLKEYGITPHSSASETPQASGLRLLGRRSDVPDLLNAMDAFVLTSRGEAFPNVLGEAMLSGVPCVSTDVGDVRSIVGDTGFVTDVGDVDAIESAWTRLIQETESERTARREQCIRRIQDNYSMPAISKQYEVLYRSLLPVARRW